MAVNLEKELEQKQRSLEKEEANIKKFRDSLRDAQAKVRQFRTYIAEIEDKIVIQKKVEAYNQFEAVLGHELTMEDIKLITQELSKRGIDDRES